MEVVLVPCISTLLRKGYSDIFELQRLIQGEKELVNLGKKSPNKWHREFFETQFDDEKLDEIVKFIFKEAKSYLDTIINSKLV